MAKKKFEEALARLEEIVTDLDNNEIELEKAMTEFKEGLELIDECEKALTNFDKEIEALINKHNLGNENE